MGGYRCTARADMSGVFEWKKGDQEKVKESMSWEPYEKTFRVCTPSSR